MLCNLILKIDNNKTVNNSNNLYDIHSCLKQLELIKSIKVFDYSIIFKDINNNFLIIECNDYLMFKNTIKFLKDRLIITFKLLDANKKIKFINTYYNNDIANNMNIYSYNIINNFINDFFIKDNINFKNDIIFLNYILN